MREVIKEAVRDGNLEDIGKDKIRVPVKSKGTREPTFKSGPKGIRTDVHTGNKEYVKGDIIPKPTGSGGAGGNKPGTGESEDDFFWLEPRDFFDLFFEDCELPNLEKRRAESTTENERVRAGFTVDGPDMQRDDDRTLAESYVRRKAMKRPTKKDLAALENLIKELVLKTDLTEDEKDILTKLLSELDKMMKRRKQIPYIHEDDCRYRNFDYTPKPCTQAAMYCIMDVSASLGKDEKDMAKRFFLILYRFLVRKYERVDLVFIRHTDVAEQVDQDTFFNGTKSGGTSVDPALELFCEIQKNKHPSDDWNIYIAQVSDGDVFGKDGERCVKRLTSVILQLVQYYAYAEITSNERGKSTLWEAFSSIEKSGKYANTFAMGKIKAINQIYPVFRKLFGRKGRGGNGK